MRFAPVVAGVVVLGFVLAGQNCGQFKPAPGAPLVQESTSTAAPGAATGGGGGTGSVGGNATGGGSTTVPVTTPTPTPGNGVTVPTSTSDVCLGVANPPAGISWVTPAQLRRYAGLDHINACGDGVTVAVIISPGSSNITADLATYSAAFGLPAPTSSNFQILMPDGNCASVSPIESHIDVDMVHALAPRAKLILACGGGSDVYAGRARAIQAAINAGASIISMSWGDPEAQANINVLEPIFQANPNVTFFAGSGDHGTNDVNGVPRVAYPASSPNVIGVAATADDGGENLTAWANSGGGISAFFPLPAYQNGLPGATNKRLVPDIAFNGSPQMPTAVYGAQGWIGQSGTSVSSPIAAGMMAIINQIYGRSLGRIHGKLYALKGSQLTYFRDVTNGSNGDYTAGAGYDLVGGLGTPRTQVLLPMLGN